MIIEDDVIPSPIGNVAVVTISEVADRPGGGHGVRRVRTGGNSPGITGAGPKGGNSGDGSQQPPVGFELPPMNKVRRDGWEERKFDEYSACTVIEEGTEEAEDDRSVYEFYINVDNIYLQTDIKHGDDDPALVEAKFVYGNVLIGLALIHDRNRTETRYDDQPTYGDDQEPIARLIEKVTRALGPFLVPMIDYLGGLSPDDFSQLSQVGDEE